VCSLGSEWLDLKLATTPRRADSVLVDLVAPFVAKMGIEQWHFLRYPEPRFHLRVRFHGEPRALVREVLPAFSDVAQGWLADGRLSDLQVGSYYREVERFGGGDGVQWIEQLFSADSVCVAGLCEWLRDQDDPEDARWRACALGIAQLARDLVPDPQSLLAALRDDFRRRVGLRGLSDQLPRLEARLASSSDLEQPRAIFRARSARIAEIAPRLRTTGLSRPLVAIAAACVHLFTNRLLRNDALHQELVLYELLARLNCSDSSA
jgi:thiopeptide-type bacteriocin biosynthesis protein